MTIERFSGAGFQMMDTGEVCPSCDGEIAVSATSVGDQVELTCSCGCSLAAA